MFGLWGIDYDGFCTQGQNRLQHCQGVSKKSTPLDTNLVHSRKVLKIFQPTVSKSTCKPKCLPHQLGTHKGSSNCSLLYLCRDLLHCLSRLPFNRTILTPCTLSSFRFTWDSLCFCCTTVLISSLWFSDSVHKPHFTITGMAPHKDCSHGKFQPVYLSINDQLVRPFSVQLHSNNVSDELFPNLTTSGFQHIFHIICIYNFCSNVFYLTKAYVFFENL